MKLVTQGSEAKIYKVNNNILRKVRVSKTYRIEKVDREIRKSRNRIEFRILQKIVGKINSPKVYNLVEDEKKDIYSFDLEFIKAKSLKEKISENNIKKAFLQIIKLHNLDIIHNDLTTLNFLVKKYFFIFEKVYLIDFGLSFYSKKVEDKAVDINLFFENLKNEHNDFYYLKKELLKTYKKEVKRGGEIITRLKKVESRGRNKN